MSTKLDRRDSRWSCARQLAKGACTVLVVVATVLLAPERSAGQESEVTRAPKLNGLVRVVAPKLGPDWQVGMYNRIRVEPPCYVVLLFSADREHSVSEILPLADLRRLQVHRIFYDQFPVRQTWEGVAGSEYWLDASLDSLQRVNERQCPKAPE